MPLEVNEIFSSIFGEGLNIGLPCTFIRLQGCNCRCTWCDTVYAQTTGLGTLMDEDSIVEKVKEFGNEWVCITGGEPMMQDLHKLLVKLSSIHKKVQVETNGSLLLKDDELITRIAMSPKLPSSRMDKNMKYEQMMKLRPGDELKFVAANESDWFFVKDLLRRYKVACEVILQPEGGTDGGWLVEKLLTVGLEKVNARVLPQLHKVFGVK